MASTLSTVPYPPSPPRSRGGCLKGCLVLALVSVLLVAGLVLSIVYGLRSDLPLKMSDPIVTAVYQHWIRPKALSLLPSHLSAEEKANIEKTMDEGLENYKKLPTERKRAVLKEAFLAAIYYAEGRALNESDLPHLYEFAREQIAAHPSPAPLAP